MVLRRQLRCLTAVAQSLQSPGTFPTTSIRCLHARIRAPPVPEPTPFVPDVQTFLTLIGRDLSQYSSKFEDWKTLFSLTSTQLKELGIEPARSRRYLIRWLDKFRYGEYGLGGDLKHVKDGVAYVRICSVHADSSVAGRVWESVHGNASSGDGLVQTKASQIPATANRDAGYRRVLLNIPLGNLSPEKSNTKASEENSTEDVNAEEAEEAAQLAEKRRLAQALTRPMSEADYAKASHVKGLVIDKSGKGLRGGDAPIVAFTDREVAKISVREGLWEDRRGHKVDGGERRKAEVRAKRRAAEAKA